VLFMSVRSARLAVVPPINGKRRDWFKVKNLDRLQLGGTGLDVEPLCPDAHRASIRAPAPEVDASYALRRVT
jgi:hypothetical protein